MLPKEIVERMIKDGQHKIHPDEYAAGEKLDAYITGRQEQLEKDLEFAMWAANHYIGNVVEGKWINAIGSKEFTTTELYVEWQKTKEVK